MLVLTRDDSSPSQSDTHLTCECGCKVTVRVVEAKRGWVKLGFEAPKTVIIDRADSSARREVPRG